MGTDITAFIEQKDKEIEGYQTVAELFIDRDYWLFSILANVRNNCYGVAKELEYVSEPKGLPENLGIWTDTDKIDHSASWLNIDEIKKAINIAEKIDSPQKCSTVDKLKKIEQIMSVYSESRIVFGFDS